MTERVSGAGECAGGKELEGASEWPEAALGCGNMPRQVEAAEAERARGRQRKSICWRSCS